MQEYRTNSRIAVSTQTLDALKVRKRGGETYDTLIRRMLISGVETPLIQLSEKEQSWVLHATTN